MLKFAIGNSKLGTKCFVVSRAVGDTCPTSCYFLDNGCYAQQTERQYKNARLAGLENTEVETKEIEKLLLLAVEKKFSIRLHERGDFGRNDTLDLNYIKAWVKALKSVKVLPDIWAYTHFYDRRLVKLLSPYMRLYASVHNSSDIKKAKQSGFSLLAYIDTDHRFMAKKPRGIIPDIPRFVSIGKDNFLVCPEQRKGRDKVTCTGGKSIACNWCVKSHGKNVAFVEH